MTRRGAKLERALLALVVCAGCGDDGGGSTGTVDAGRSLDSGVVACADAAGCAEQSFARVCASGRCAECEAAGDCRENPVALGPGCDVDRGYCVCADDSDCDDNPNGPSCNAITQSCGCISDQDCPDPQTCLLEPYLGGGVRTCQPR